MQRFHFEILFVFLVCSLQSCVQAPDINLISKDIGISIPQEYKIAYADSDPFGPPSDVAIKYVLQFDSAGYAELIKSIEGSILFNIVPEKVFDTLNQQKKIDIVKMLAKHRMSSYWIRSDTSYIYDGEVLFLNDRDQTCNKLAAKGIYLPNYDSSHVNNSFHFPVYRVVAIVDRRKQKLYYNYVHP